MLIIKYKTSLIVKLVLVVMANVITYFRRREALPENVKLNEGRREVQGTSNVEGGIYM